MDKPFSYLSGLHGSTGTRCAIPSDDVPAGLATPGGHYSHVAIANGLIFVSGQLPIDPNGRKLTESPFEDQAEQVLANLSAAFVGAGSDASKLNQVRVYIVDGVEHWATFHAIE